MIKREQIGTSHVETINAHDLYTELLPMQPYHKWLYDLLEPLEENQDYIVIRRLFHQDHIIKLECLK
jgi:phage anti-repressor protein